MTCKQGLALLTLFAWSALAPAQTLPAGVQKLTTVEGITEYSLPNGLHVLLFPDDSNAKVTVNVTYVVPLSVDPYSPALVPARIRGPSCAREKI